MTRKWTVALSAAVVLLLGSSSFAADTVGSTSLFPTAVGSTWVYTNGLLEITEKVTKHELVGGEMCARVETIYNGKTVSFEHMAVRADGVYRVAVGGKSASPAFCLFPLPVKSADAWEIASTVEGRSIKGRFASRVEKAKVPAGEYQVLAVEGKDFEMAGQKVQFTYFFAPNVGKVKQLVKFGETESALELKKFTPGA